jgi:hypothetical protein
VHILQGAQDLLTVPESTKPDFDGIQAPRKSYVLVPRAGHDPNPAMLAAQFKLLKDKVGECRQATRQANQHASKRQCSLLEPVGKPDQDR